MAENQTYVFTEKQIRDFYLKVVQAHKDCLMNLQEGDRITEEERQGLNQEVDDRAVELAAEFLEQGNPE